MEQKLSFKLWCWNNQAYLQNNNDPLSKIIPYIEVYQQETEDMNNTINQPDLINSKLIIYLNVNYKTINFWKETQKNFFYLS